MAAPILAFEDLGLVQGSGWLFRHLDLHIGPNDRLALIGRNGAGKTTLLRLLAGAIEADEGRRTIVPGTRVILLQQEPSIAGFATLRDFAMAGPGAPPAHAVDAIADQIGIDLDRDAATASGGERRRAAIARALAMEPDVLLLDEPTNHLDLHAIEWLENWLARFSGAFVAISHDRAFLMRLTRQTLWLDRGQMRRKEIGFGGFEAWTETVYDEEARNADRLDAKLKLEEHWLLRGVTARRSRNQGRLAKLHEMRATRASMIGPQGTAKLAVASDDAKTKIVIDAEHATKRFGAPPPPAGHSIPSPVCPEPVEGRAAGDTLAAGASISLGTNGRGGAGEARTIIRDFTFRVTRGDRIGIVGANGAGKTTLLRLLTGEIEPDEGRVKRAKTLTGIVIDQQRKLMAPEKRVRDILADGGDWVEVRGIKKHVAGYLKEFLFAPELIDARIGTLSGGERSRLLLAREFARESNLLVLDEPTNDLDLETLDLLQEVISDYEGTVLIVSHDRDFLDRTVTVTLGLDGSGKVDVVAGGYADWVAKRAAQAPRGSDRAKASAAPPTPQAPRAKLSYKDQRDLDLLPAEIEKIEAAIARDEAALAGAGLYARDPARFQALSTGLETARRRKEEAEMRWLELAEMAEGLSR